MIQEVLNREFVLEQLREVRKELEAEVEDGRRSGGPRPEVDDHLTDEDFRAALEELRAAEQRERDLSSGQEGFEPPAGDGRRGDEPATLDDYAFISHDPVVSNLQSALEEYFEEREDVHAAEDEEDDDGRRGGGRDQPSAHAVAITDRRLGDTEETVDPDGRRLFEKFSKTDVGWISSLVAEGVRKFRKKHPFVDRPAAPFELPDRCRLVVCADWGSGVPRAREVGRQMRRQIEQAQGHGLPVHVLHLGDVYYSGWKREYQKRFLAHWPVETGEAGEIASFSTNANHDMYSGGHAYYKVLLGDRRFAAQDGSSLFSLVHPQWKLLGLDTAWEDKDLVGGQKDWLLEETRKAREAGQRVVLLSHHQPFSAYESNPGKVPERVQPVLDTGAVAAWFWGHEHRCAVYERRPGLPFGCCLGHGGVPAWQWKSDRDPVPDGVRFEYRGRFKSGVEWWGRFGFVTLDLDGARITVRFFNEQGGEPDHQEVVT